MPDISSETDAPTGATERKTVSDRAPDDKGGGEKRALLFKKLKSWAKQDFRHSAAWRKNARLNYDMVANRQWTKSEAASFEDQGKVPLQFNHMLTIVKSIAGHEIQNRNELKFMPRGVEDTAPNDVLNAANMWMADGCDAEDEESDAFEDVNICGMGWTEHRLARDVDADGQYIEQRIDPIEMGWDKQSKSKNLHDARRIHRVIKVDMDTAKKLFPGVDPIALDAKWIGAEEGEGQDPVPIEERRLHMSGIKSEDVDMFERAVTIVETQWWDLEPVHFVAQPESQDMVTMSPSQFSTFKERAEQIGFSFKSARRMRRKYHRGFLGSSSILRLAKSPAGDSFTYTAITGERDRNKNTWFGVVDVMTDPQKFSNKMLTNTLHLMNVQSKGGIMAETDAFEDQRQAEDTWAKPQDITWMAEGALSGQKPKVQEKPVAAFPAGFWQLLEFGISSIRDIPGVNLELLGAAGRNQPGILEAQRKQAGLIILASLFNNLRRFRKQVGRIRLHFIQTFFSDGRLVRIAGPLGAESVPLAREKTTGRFDVVVDEAASTTSTKHETWTMLVQIFPAISELLTPRMILQMLRYSPLPESLLNEIEEIANNEEENPEAAQAQQAQQKALLDSIMAGITRDLSAAEKDEASSQKLLAETMKIVAELGEKGSLSDPNVQRLVQMAAEAATSQVSAENQQVQALASLQGAQAPSRATAA